MWISRNPSKDEFDKISIWAMKPLFDRSLKAYVFDPTAGVSELFEDDYYVELSLDRFDNIFGFLPDSETCLHYNLNK